MVLVQTRATCDTTWGNSGFWLSYVVFIRRVLRTRYAAPIGIVDTSGGLAGLVYPLMSGLSTGIPYRKHRVIMV
jgi:hypothetical protein